jgi:predicted dehydrogenase
MNVGILGFAHGHVGVYCGRWRKEPDLGIRVVAGWDHDAGRLAKAAAEHGVEPRPTADALLADPAVEAVVIGAETSMHADLVERAAAAGKPIVLQKPMALTTAEADRIVAAVDRAGVPFTMAWQMRVDPHNLEARDLMQSGRFGKLLIVRRRHTLATHLWKGFEALWHNDPRLNRDIFADDAAHAADFLYWLRGMPESVVCEMGTLVNPRVPNDNAVAVFRWADGAFGEMFCSFTAPGGENALEMTFEKGVIVGNHGDGPSTSAPWPPGAVQLKWWLHGDAAWTLSGRPAIRSQGERLEGLAAPLAEFLHGRRPPVATAAEGRDVLRMILACYESNESGRRVRLA